jgi:hypothetical protein
MARNETAEKLFEELAYRENDGVQVWLLWTPGEDRLTVFVADSKTDDAFELPVDRQRALDVFHHPYAHAAFRSQAPSAVLAA